MDLGAGQGGLGAGPGELGAGQGELGAGQGELDLPHGAGLSSHCSNSVVDSGSPFLSLLFSLIRSLLRTISLFFSLNFRLSTVCSFSQKGLLGSEMVEEDERAESADICLLFLLLFLFIPTELEGS